MPSRLTLRRLFAQAGLAFLVWLATAAPLRAERFLTVAEAQKQCFPQADAFEERVLRFTPEDRRAIEKQAGVRVLNQGNRIWVARQGSNVLGVVFVDYVLGKHELIDYVVAVSAAGQVRHIEILEYRESYGGDIRGGKWREQFKGKSAAATLKLNDDVYNISGATISCRHVTEGVKRVLATFEQVVRPRLPAPGVVPDARPARER